MKKLNLNSERKRTERMLYKQLL